MTTAARSLLALLLSTTVLLCAATRAPLGLADDAPAAEKALEATLHKLEKDIAEVRGLPFKSPVVARIIPRPKETAKKLQGYYSIKDKALFIYNDIAGAYERGVLIHEMVHALQDQHFGLAKLHQTDFGSDGERALAALIEGDATFTMIELLKKDQPRVAAMLDVPLEKARNIEQAFLYAQGARYVKALKERGGWEAVNRAYRFPPRSTASILHPEGVASIDLGPGKKHGEFGLIQMLAAHPETAPLAVQAAAGWRGDRSIADGNRTAQVVAFATVDQAKRFQAAMAQLKAAQQPSFKSVQADAAGNVWHGPGEEVLAVLARGQRVLVLAAPDRAAYRSLLDRLEGPLALHIYSARDKRAIGLGELIERLLDVDLVCIGENHDSELHHRVQLQLIKALFASDERLGVGMEMFQRSFQTEIDRYFKGEITEEEFLKASEYRQRWGFDWSLYRPIADFCRRNGVPLAALNVPDELRRRLSKAGFAGLSDKEKGQLGPIDFQLKEHRDYWYDRLAKMHGDAKVSDEQKERTYQVMTAWDEYMGASAARFQTDRQLRRMVVLAGSGHIDRGFGIPARAAKRTGGKVATVHIEVGVDPAKATAEPVTDFIVIVK
jgi:uncharacterized iron-regulated protein